MFNRVYHVGCLCDSGSGLPDQIKFRLRNLIWVFFIDWLVLFFFSVLVKSLLLFIISFEDVAVLKHPLAPAIWFIVSELSFIEHAVGVDPLSSFN